MIKRLISGLGALALLAGGLAASTAPAVAAPTPVTPQAAAVVYSPPARLPWGDAPASQPFKAAPVVSAAQIDKNRKAPKGAPQPRSASKSGASSKSVSGGNTYWYATADQTLSGTGTTGVYANGTIATPVLNGAAHSLGEIAVIQGGGATPRQIVEIGWNVDPTLYGDSVPHLFGYWWKNGKGQGYNGGSGFVAWSSPSGTLGQSLSAVSGTSKKFGIEHTGSGATGAWWLAYDAGWVGYYPDTLWNTTTYGIPPSNTPAVTTFTSIPYYQMFGEVTYAGTTQTLANSCAWMGNGYQGTATVAPLSASWGTGALVTTGGAVNANMAILTPGDTPNYTSQITASGRTHRYGGRLTVSPC